MKSARLLNCLEKRDLLNQTDTSLEILLEWGGRYRQAGFLYDAVDFYAEAGAREALLALLETARTEGDLFLFQRLHGILAQEPRSEQWLALAEQAEQLGKHRFALEGYRRAGAEDKIRHLQELLNAEPAAEALS
jgi:DNA-binding SARP family transcriptional activator